MFDFSKTLVESKMTKEDVLNNQQMIFEYYFGQTITPKKRYRNPLRADKHEGCFFRWKNGIRLYDYAASKIYDVFSFVEELYNTDFLGALEQIDKDFKLGTPQQVSKQFASIPFDEEEESKHTIQFKPRPLTSLDRKWWSEYLITEDELKKENVYSVEKLYIDSLLVSTPEMCFAYHYPEIDAVKVYKPLEDKKYKWYSNVPFDHIDGLRELDFSSDTVLIAKSKKDKIVLQKIVGNVCATQGENYHAIPEECDDFFNRHYKRKVCFFDCDPPGQAANKKLNERGYGWVNIENYLYECCGVKDPSDYVKEFKDMSYLINLLKSKNIV